ncbi:MAG: hypothetical protein H6702_13710 [Myxococcales bacterium]|nr:hypothetical protein [Myxococcales bacterium]
MKSDLVKLGHGAKTEGEARHKPEARPKDRQKTRQAQADRAGDAERKGEQPGPPGPARPKAADSAQAKQDQPEAKRPLGEGPFQAPEPKLAEGQPAGGGGDPGGAAAPDDYRDLLPSLGPEAVARKDGSIDHLPEVNEGNGTFLNTQEYKHAWFFNRVKRQVQQRWRAVDAHRRYDPYGRIYGVRDRLTVVEVTLNKDGSLMTSSSRRTAAWPSWTTRRCRRSARRSRSRTRPTP